MSQLRKLVAEVEELQVPRIWIWQIEICELGSYKGGMARLFCLRANFQKMNCTAGRNKEIGCFFLILCQNDQMIYNKITSKTSLNFVTGAAKNWRAAVWPCLLYNCSLACLQSWLLQVNLNKYTSLRKNTEFVETYKFQILDKFLIKQNILINFSDINTRMLSQFI